MAAYLSDVPTDRVVHLYGVDPQALQLIAERVDPMIVNYYPDHSTGLPQAVSDLLDELTALAVRLYPIWLPDAAEVRAPRLVRALALRRAAAESYFGPFLADLAVRAVTGGRGATRLPAEVRAAGLARLITTCSHRDRLVLVMHPPPAGAATERERPVAAGTGIEAPPPVEPDLDALVAAANWFVRHGRVGCWLVGECWGSADDVARVTVTPPDTTARPVEVSATPPVWAHPPAASLAVIRGRPRADSGAERALEAALSRQPWAHGRGWNQTYQSDPLTPAILVDLIWTAERCIVEIDGAEHRGRLQFQADRRRDVQLQLDGYAVLRFTNDQIRYELDLVLDQLERFINLRRLAIREEATDGRRQALA